MKVTYRCNPASFVEAPSQAVVKLRIPEQIDQLCVFWGEQMPAEDREAFAGLCASGRQEDYGIILEDKIVARACIWHVSPQRGEIGAVKVLAAYRSMGFGTALVSHCTRTLISRGIDAIGITEDDNFAMRRVFEKLGFRVEQNRQ